MMPPDCCICDKRLDEDEGGLVSFARRPSDKEWDERMERTKMVGHPPYMRWFCGRHHAAAVQHKHLTVDEAMPLIRGE